MQVYYSAPPPDHNFNRRHVGQNMSIAGTWQGTCFLIFFKMISLYYVYHTKKQAFRILAAHIQIQKHMKKLSVSSHSYSAL
jgi:hypothetical protein